MVKIATQPLNFVRKIKNMSNIQGKTVNKFAKSMKKEGYKNIYQRAFNNDRCALTGKKADGTTKSYILSSGGYARKINKTINQNSNTKIHLIDKSYHNENGFEIYGVRKFKKFINNVLSAFGETHRGWIFK